jgi:NAD(P)H dehydrogenase (quinone)
MSQIGVLVTFYSRCGATEKLALAAAVGAVQKRANIRLRRLPDLTTAALEEFPECREALLRMRKEYVAPAEPDILWADALIFGAPARSGGLSDQWAGLLALLARLRAEGKLEGKLGAVIVPSSGQNGEGESVFSSLTTAVLEVGLLTVPPKSSGKTGVTIEDAESAVALGRRVAGLARAVKVSSVQ